MGGFTGVFNEFQEDLDWAANRPTSEYNTTHAHINKPRWEGLQRADPKLFELALNAMETGFLAGYCKQIGKQVAVQVGQNPLTHAQHSLGDRMHTLMRNMELVFTYDIAIPRWLSGSEAAQTQHFRMAPALRKKLGKRFENDPLCCYHELNGERTSRSMRHQSGNSMDIWSVLIAFVHHWYFATPSPW